MSYSTNPITRPVAAKTKDNKNPFADNVQLTSPDELEHKSRYNKAGLPVTASRKDPRNWSRRCWIIVGAVSVIVLIIIIVIAVVVCKKDSYPNYSKINYSLTQSYSGTSFFDNFNYFTGYDPSQGFVHYVDGPGSVALNLTVAGVTSASLKVDTSNTDTTTGRKSVRIASKDTYDDGLFIFDIAHTPYGCTTWPALWLTDQSNWPTNGEIDVLEAVNTAATGNQMTLHTTNGCSMSDVKRKQTGKTLTTNCYNGTDGNSGCGVQGPTASYGEEFNKNGGGVYALELRSAGIRTWFFPRGDVPADIITWSTNKANGGSPDPSTWSEPLADFPSTDCNIGSHFKNQSIIVDIDLCGQLAGNSRFYNNVARCPGSCKQYVSTQPGGAYNNAYWAFNNFRVYQAS